MSNLSLRSDNAPSDQFLSVALEFSPDLEEAELRLWSEKAAEALYDAHQLVDVALEAVEDSHADLSEADTVARQAAEVLHEKLVQVFSLLDSTRASNRAVQKILVDAEEEVLDILGITKSEDEFVL